MVFVRNGCKSALHLKLLLLEAAVMQTHGYGSTHKMTPNDILGKSSGFVVKRPNLGSVTGKDGFQPTFLRARHCLFLIQIRLYFK